MRKERRRNRPRRRRTESSSHARAAGFDLSNAVWSRLDGDERFALIKMGDAETPSHNLGAALKEFSVPRDRAS